MVNNTDRITRIEAIIGIPPEDGFSDLVTRSVGQEQQIQQILQRISEMTDNGAGPSSSTQSQREEERDAHMEELQNRMRLLASEVETLRQEGARQHRADHPHPSQIRVPEPKPFSGARNAKELENFVWDVEEYFSAMDIPEARRLRLACVFLAGDAKLWWRTRSAEDRNAGRPGIASWEALKEELKIQFLPHNVIWVARDQLKRLKQTGSIREYVKDFSSLLLDIPDMSEADKLFNFTSGLQNWAQVELRRQAVRDLNSAMAAAESLVDFRSTAPTPALGDKGKGKAKAKAKEGKPPLPKDKRKKKKTAARKEKGPLLPSRDATATAGQTSGCFICGGPHRAKDCPKKSKLTALISQLAEESSEEEEPSRVYPLQALNVLVTKKPTSCKGLLFAKVRVNGHELRAMIDTGATDNFIANDVAKELGLLHTTCATLIKTVNSRAARVDGLTTVNMELGPWSGPCKLMVIPLDDFQIILGLEFLKAVKAMILPHLGGLMIGLEDCAGFVPTAPPSTDVRPAGGGAPKENSGSAPAAQQKNAQAGRDTARPAVQPQSGRPRTATDHSARSGAKGSTAPGGLLSAKQISRGLRKGDQTYVAALIQVQPDAADAEEVPAPVGEMLKEFADLMPGELPKELPPRRAHDHRIELEPGARAPAKAPYRMAPAELKELRSQLDELLAAGLIQPSRAPYGAPVLFQRKKDGTLRMCVDYRALNKVTVKNRYPVPNAADLFDRLAKAEYFSKLDLRSGYWQVRIAPGDEAKTTCVTRYGSFEFLVMPFGLTNAPATFCNLMTDVLYDFLDDFVVVYLDDIVIYSGDLQQHVAHLRKVLSRLREHRLYIKKEKCAFAQTEISFLGHIVGHGAIRMDSAKVRAIMDWPAPTAVSELRSFLGLANYYRRFIRGYSALASPLTDLLKKEHRWDWSSHCEEAFERLKTALSTEPVLQLPKFEDPFEVHTDASDRALGGVLIQTGHPVAFESRKFKDAETRYSAHEKEMTAVIHCLEVWRHYLLGTKFKIITDNVANTYFKTQRKLTPKQARWQEYLAEFDFDWEHRPGRQNQVADALSRQTVQEYVAAVATVQAGISDRVREAAQTDTEYARLMRDTSSGAVRRFWIQDGLLRAKGGRLVVPRNEDLRRDLLKESHDSKWAGHPGMERMYALLSRDFYWPKMWRDVEAYVRSCLTCQMDKVERKRPAGLLQPLPVPARPWASVSMDFIMGFPEVDGKRAVFVVVDRFSKYAIFMAVPETCTAEMCAGLFFANVVKYFGLPGDIISDRDVRFTGKFWTTLFQIVGTDLKFSTAYHPQTDGQTERVNALLEEYLRHFVTASQRNWLELLDAAQFSYNLNRSSATEETPAELCLGYQPRTPLEVARSYDGPCPAAHLFARDRTERIAKARDSLVRTAMQMKIRADAHRRPVEFQVGDLVMLKITPYLLRKSTKRKFHKALLPRYDGPFKVIRRVGEVAYKLALPARLKIHPVFHVSFLKPYHGDLTPDEIEVPGRLRPAIRPRFARRLKRILADRKIGTSQGPQYTEYLVQWQGEETTDATWRRAEELWQFEEEIQAYLRESATGTSAPSGGGGLSPPQ